MQSTVEDRIMYMDLVKMVNTEAKVEAQKIFDSHANANHVLFIIKGPNPEIEEMSVLKIYRNMCWELKDVASARDEIRNDIARGAFRWDDDMDPLDMFGRDLYDEP